jgi:hypothetical protein
MGAGGANHGPARPFFTDGHGPQSVAVQSADGGALITCLTSIGM